MDKRKQHSYKTSKNTNTVLLISNILMILFILVLGILLPLVSLIYILLIIGTITSLKKNAPESFKRLILLLNIFGAASVIYLAWTYGWVFSSW